MNNEAILFNYLMQNRSHIDALLQPVRDDAGDHLEHRIMKDTFEDRARWILIADMVIHCKLSSDAVREFVQNLNMNELLK